MKHSRFRTSGAEVHSVGVGT